MRSMDLTIDERYFNLLWRSLHAREREMLGMIAADEDSDDAALLSNDVVYLRLCMRSLEAKAREAGFPEHVFSLSEEFIDLADL